MKKTLVSALTTALVVGAASTTFAAANPFSDVPAGNWAYNAVAMLANEGVVNGFPNGTFQGNKTMTRYEMAQIVAKAMAYENKTKAQKATVEKLAAEFSQELGNLGVRVSNLENKVDNVKFTGKVEYTYTNVNEKNKNSDGSTNELKFRLDPTAQINSKWVAKARLDYTVNPAADTDNKNEVKVDRIYVEGQVGKATVDLGKYPAFLAEGLTFDNRLSGAAVVLPTGKSTVTLAAGRFNTKDADKDSKEIKKTTKDFTADVYAAQLTHKFGKVEANAGYLTLRGMDKAENNKHGRNNIWSVGAKAEVAKDLKLAAQYAKSSLAEKTSKEVKSAQDKAYSVELSYKAHDEKKVGSYDVFAAYRNLGKNVALEPTYDAIAKGQKGMEYGVAYVPAENVVTTVKYFHGKNLVDNNKVNTLWARAEFLF